MTLNGVEAAIVLSLKKGEIFFFFFFLIINLKREEEEAEVQPLT